MSEPPAWWPDWTGQDCVIVASGPSAKAVPLELGRGKARYIAINRSWELAPWADVLYGCDFKWWNSVGGCPGFEGLRISRDSRVSSHPAWNIQVIHLYRDDRIQLERGTVGWGSNGGFQAFNLALQWHPRRILLVGFDHTLAHGVHWHGSHPNGMNNPSLGSMHRWIRAMDGAAAVAKELGVEIVNCSMVSALQKYPKMPFEEAIACPAPS